MWTFFLASATSFVLLSLRLIGRDDFLQEEAEKEFIEFMSSPSTSLLPPSLSPSQRRVLHNLGEYFGCDHKSCAVDSKGIASVLVTKTPATPLLDATALLTAMESFRQREARRRQRGILEAFYASKAQEELRLHSTGSTVPGKMALENALGSTAYFRSLNTYKYTLRAWIEATKSSDDLFVQASTEDGDDEWTRYPIGMGISFLRYPQAALQSVAEKPLLLLVAFAAKTDEKRRSSQLCRARFAETLASNGFANQALDPAEYFEALGRHKFTASPEGNGIDCHRHYEALMAGSVPIVERCQRTECSIAEKYRGCPILWTTDFTEVTENFLLAAYAEMLDREYDFSALFLSAYDSEVQAEARQRGNYWCRKLEGREWYLF